MKKYLEIAVGVMAVVGAVGTVQAQNVTACSGTAAGTYSVTAAGGTQNFVQVTFTGRCSANVNMSYAQNATVMAVGAASRKGGNVFGGHSNGGGVSPTGAKCPAAGCTITEANTATTAKLAEGSSS